LILLFFRKINIFFIVKIMIIKPIIKIDHIKRHIRLINFIVLLQRRCTENIEVAKIHNFKGISQLAAMILIYFCSRCSYLATEFRRLNFTRWISVFNWQVSLSFPKRNNCTDRYLWILSFTKLELFNLSFYHYIC